MLPSKDLLYRCILTRGPFFPQVAFSCAIKLQIYLPHCPSLSHLDVSTAFQSSMTTIDYWEDVAIRNPHLYVVAPVSSGHHHSDAQTASADFGHPCRMRNVNRRCIAVYEDGERG